MGNQIRPATNTTAGAGSSDPEFYLDRQIGVRVSEGDYVRIIRTARELGMRPPAFARLAMLEFIDARNRRDQGGIKE